MHEEARATMTPSLPCKRLAPLLTSIADSAVYLLAVETALISLDGDELLAGDRETVGERVIGGGVSGDQGVDFFLGELGLLASERPRERERLTAKPGEAALRPEKSTARIPALSN